jgi:glutamine synthetase
MDHREVLAAARRSGVKLIRFEYCDVSGVARSKAIHVSQLAHKLVEGVALTRAQMSINMLEQMVHIEGMEPVGEIRLVPDPATFTVLPWATASAGVLCDQVGHDRLSWGACPRSYLKAIVARAAEQGITVQATFENEYYLAREQDGRFVPFDVPGHAPVYSPIGHDLSAAIMVETADALESQGICVEQAINEYGPRHRPWRGLAARAARLVRAQAVPRSDRQRRPRSLQPVGCRRRAQPALRHRRR